MRSEIRISPSIGDHGSCWLYARADALHARKRADRSCPTDQAAGSQRLFDAHLSDPDQALFVSEVDGAVVGRERVQTIERLEITDVAALAARPLRLSQELVVAQTYHRRSIATRLMTKAHRWPRDRELTQIELNVYEFNQPALRL